jgi:hypothetical protein
MPPNDETPPAGGLGGAPVENVESFVPRTARRRHARAVSRHQSVRQVDQADSFVAADMPPWIPPGRYEAGGVDVVVFQAFRSLKARVGWDVIVPDQLADYGQRVVRLHRFYNVRRVGGRIVPPPYGHYVREWTLVAGRRPSRGDRIGPRAFFGVSCLVEVRTVEADSEQESLPACARYSIVARVLERLAGGVRL